MISRKQLDTDQTSPRWKKVKNETFYYHIEELNVIQKQSSMVTYLYFQLILFQYISTFNCQKLWFCNGI